MDPIALNNEERMEKKMEKDMETWILVEIL